MKYALVVYESRPTQTTDQLMLNVGNYMQWLAIEHLYEYMGIPESDVVRLTSEQLKTYHGEPMILPINYLMSETKECSYIDENNDFIFSDAIIPVFLGLSIRQTHWHWDDKKTEYLKKHEPIGCRDYSTWKALVNRGIRAYLAGCLTATFPLRKKAGQNKVFFVEAPAQLREFIPDSILKSAEFRFHQKNLSQTEFYDETFAGMHARSMLEEYRDNARLVVTSRLHGAIPCMAMGIPVVLVKEYFGFPFDLQRRFLPFYTYRNFNEIDWDPKPVDIENYKKVALKCAADRILGSTEMEKSIRQLHSEYDSIYAQGYQEEQMDLGYFQKQLRGKFKRTDEFDYAIWGISSDAERICQIVTDYCPRARMTRIIDAFRKIDFHGISSEKPNVLTENPDLIVFVTTLNCSTFANEFFQEIGKPRDTWISVTEGVLEG